MGSEAWTSPGDLEATADNRSKDNDTCGIYASLGGGAAWASIYVIFIIIASLTKDPEFSVSAFNISSFHLSPWNNTLSSDFSVVFSIKNPNSKARYAYDQISATVLYDGDSVAQGLIRPFNLPPKNVSNLTVLFSADGMTVGDNVADGIRSDRSSSDGTVKFRVSVVSHVVKIMEGGDWRRYTGHELRVSCKGIGVRFDNATAETGSMIGPTRGCDVMLARVQEQS